LDVNKFTSDLDLVQNMNEYFEKVRQEEFQKVKKKQKRVRGNYALPLKKIYVLRDRRFYQWRRIIY
jgi:hypothetical protein